MIYVVGFKSVGLVIQVFKRSFCSYGFSAFHVKMTRDFYFLRGGCEGSIFFLQRLVFLIDYVFLPLLRLTREVFSRTSDLMGVHHFFQNCLGYSCWDRMLLEEKM